MSKYVILSSNDNPKYFYFTPLIIWAWKKLGWDVRMIYNRDSYAPRGKQAYIEELVGNTVDPEGLWRPLILNNIEEYQSETITQVSRLFGSCFLDPLTPFSKRHLVDVDDFLMTSDIDMLPLSDIWSMPAYNKILPVCWGRDLTDYHFPICYIGMSAKVWHKLMGLRCYNFDDEIQKALDERPEAKGNDKVKRWVTDQNLITEKLLQFEKIPGNGTITRIDRGTDKRTGYPLGRVDRSNWRLDHVQLIDAHLPHDILTNDKSFHNVMELLHLNWPREDFKWFVKYHQEFKKLL
jgi:hypothetical protein